MKGRVLMGISWLLLGITACGEEKSPTQVRPWIELKEKWQGVSGGLVENEEPLTVGWGETITTVRWTGVIPEPPFELEYEAKRVNGTDFFGTVTFPAGRKDEYLSLVVGGWGGATVGISSISGKDASENETTTLRKFKNDVWYHIRLVRDGERIAAWIDGEKVVDLDTTGKELGLREGEISQCAPFGFATWQSTGMIRNARWRGL